MAKKIMIVDDEPNLIELVKAVFEAEKFEVITAIDGPEALQKLGKTRPDLAVIDMMMPGMSGRELVEKIRKNPKTKDLKVIFLTVAKFSDVGKKILEELNVVDYITKPFENDDLVQRVKKVLG